jgi:hypothetical protein
MNVIAKQCNMEIQVLDDKWHYGSANFICVNQYRLTWYLSYFARQITLRKGEKLIDQLDSVEDTKGNNGERGMGCFLLNARHRDSEWTKWILVANSKPLPKKLEELVDVLLLYVNVDSLQMSHVAHVFVVSCDYVQCVISAISHQFQGIYAP